MLVPGTTWNDQERHRSGTRSRRSAEVWPNAESGPNDPRKDAPPFTIKSKNALTVHKILVNVRFFIAKRKKGVIVLSELDLQISNM